MGTRYRAYEPGQLLLLPPSLREWLPEGHLAYAVSDLVDELDTSAFFVRYSGDGRRNAPYHPRMMLKVLIYAYATGVFSSRGIARKLEEDVGFRVLAAGNRPQHRTICEFRRRHLVDFRRLFMQVVELARASGLVRLGRISIDGTKVRANASKRKAMSYDRMRSEEDRLSREVKELLARAQRADEEEDARYGKDRRGDEIPEEMRRREERLARIRAAKRRLEAEQRRRDAAQGRKPGQERAGNGKRYRREYGEPEARAQSNFTDPESGIMKTSSEGFQQCYNAQMAVDDAHQVVVATELTASASDQGEMVRLVERVEEDFGSRPETVLADAGYCNERDLVRLEALRIDGYVSVGREGKERKDGFGRRQPAIRRMAAKLKTEAGRKTYGARKWLSEGPHGWIKQVMGFRRFSVRGLRKAQGEWDLVCLALNVKRLTAMSAP